MNHPPAPEANVLAKIASAARTRLWQAVLYELQTGGGMCLPLEVTRQTDLDRTTRQLKAIHATLSRLRQLFVSAPERIAARLSRPNLRLLDVGAGKAPWSLAIASRDPTISVVAVDLPDQMAILQDAVNASGFAVQFRLVGMDVLGAGWPPADAFDLVIVANVCHLFDERRNRELLGRVAQSLSSTGTLAIIDQILDEDPDWARWGSLYLLGALHSAPGGHLFPIRKYEGWLSELGSWDVAASPVCPLPPLTLITAFRTH